MDTDSRTLMYMTQNNGGAMACMQGLLAPSTVQQDVVDHQFILNTIADYSIIGTDLFVLWSDICNKDYGLMHYILKEAPQAEVVQASSKQDYSGREILKKYIDSYAVYVGEYDPTNHDHI